MPQPSGKASRKWRRQIASIRRPRTPSRVPAPLRPESQARRTKEPLRSLREPSLRGSRPLSVQQGISPPKLRSPEPPLRLQNLCCATLHLHCYREMPLSYLPLLGLGAIWAYASTIYCMQGVSTWIQDKYFHGYIGLAMVFNLILYLNIF